MPLRPVWFHDTVTRITFLGYLSEDRRWLNRLEGGGRWNASDATHWAIPKHPELPAPPKQTKPDCNHFVPGAHGHTATCARWVASRGAIYACDPGAEWCEYEPKPRTRPDCVRAGFLPLGMVFCEVARRRAEAKRAGAGVDWSCYPDAEWCEYEPQCNAVDALRRLDYQCSQIDNLRAEVLALWKKYRHHRHRAGDGGKDTGKPRSDYPCGPGD